MKIKNRNRKWNQSATDLDSEDPEGFWFFLASLLLTPSSSWRFLDTLLIPTLSDFVFPLVLCHDQSQQISGHASKTQNYKLRNSGFRVWNLQDDFRIYNKTWNTKTDLTPTNTSSLFFFFFFFFFFLEGRGNRENCSYQKWFCTHTSLAK